MLFPTSSQAVSIELNQIVYFIVANKLPRLGVQMWQATGCFAKATRPLRGKVWLNLFGPSR
jgi:hypothetical protein